MLFIESNKVACKKSTYMMCLLWKCHFMTHSIRHYTKYWSDLKNGLQHSALPSSEDSLCSVLSSPVACLSECFFLKSATGKKPMTEIKLHPIEFTYQHKVAPADTDSAIGYVGFKQNSSLVVVARRSEMVTVVNPWQHFHHCGIRIRMARQLCGCSCHRSVNG